ncbi:MAG: YggS family pyridoxal phosphate-dependent enzyme [Candidatus Marinimicrobia bacterium]|nr:YggS family pyridoxal phosphate-dependent enzyme [Candidatus Neomarinimicrobiota bacterium]
MKEQKYHLLRKLSKKRMKKRKKTRIPKQKKVLLKNRIKEVLKNIESSKAAGQEVKLLAVTKTHPKEVIQKTFDCGIKFFGENKVQEAEKKYIDRPKGLELHLIGALQTNKINKALKIFDVIQSVDSLKLAKNINKRAFAISKKQRIFCQINIGKDPQKIGFTVDEFEYHVEEIINLSSIKLEGIMTILPNNIDDNKKNQLFTKTKKITEKTSKMYSMPLEVSMGMSGDYEAAIEKGSTMVRVGSKLYGPRK